MNMKEKPTDAWSTFVLSIFKLNGLIMRVGDSIAKPIGQSSARWQILGRAFEPQTVAKMAREMGHSRQSVQEIADILVKEGLIVYKTHPTDRRTKLLELTPQGMEVLNAIYLRQVKWTQHIMTKLNPKQLLSVTESLENIGQILEVDEEVNTK